MEKLHHTFISVTIFILYQVVCKWFLFSDYTAYSRIQSAIVLAEFLNEKKVVRGSNPHLSFNRPLPTRQTA